MRKKKPIPAVIDQVRITRDGNDAIIEYVDPTIPETRLTIGPQMKTMTDRDIVDVFNGVMAAQQRLLEDWDRTVTEIPPGKPQIEHRIDCDQWVPRGEVLRCIADDGGPDGEVTPTKSCPWPSSESSSDTMPAGACGSRSFQRNASRRTQK
jgi:hypothetical protein